MIFEKDEIERVVEKLLEPILKIKGITLVDLELMGSGNRKILKVFIDKPGGVTITDCQRVSDELSLALDEYDPIPGPYVLEVSSPGLNRVLRKDRELKWAIGKRIRVITTEGEFRGILVDFSKDSLDIERQGKKMQFQRENILKIQLDEVGV